MSVLIPFHQVSISSDNSKQPCPHGTGLLDCELMQCRCAHKRDCAHCLHFQPDPETNGCSGLCGHDESPQFAACVQFDDSCGVFCDLGVTA